MQKHIREILKGLEVVYVKGDISKLCSGIVTNSKDVKKDNLFICHRGKHYNGKDFISEALFNGAIGIVCEEGVDNFPEGKVLIVVKNSYFAEGIISSNFYDKPSEKILLIGVTGTNGKTTITYILESIFASAGYKVGVIGTINYRFLDKKFESSHTTPFPSELQKILFDMVESGVEVVVMEVSSHSLVQNRVAGCEFDVAVFTNLSSEHLDYHKTMEEYFKAKSILFKNMIEKKKNIFTNSVLGTKSCVINVDNEWGRQMVLDCGIKNILTFGKDKDSSFRWNNVKYELSGTTFEIKFNGKNVEIETQLIGSYNIENIVASFVVAYSQGIELEKIVSGIKKVSHIPGRLEKIDSGRGFVVIIDYAHTPDALEKVIKVMRHLPHKRLIVLFGCGGDRDRTKRPLMGAIATSLADYVVITSDNPRSEDPERIILDIEVGIKRINKSNYEICIDRKEAILKVLKNAKEGDIILLAGKGHENYQILGDRKVPFDEREIVKEGLRLQ